MFRRSVIGISIFFSLVSFANSQEAPTDTSPKKEVICGPAPAMLEVAAQQGLMPLFSSKKLEEPVRNVVLIDKDLKTIVMLVFDAKNQAACLAWIGNELHINKEALEKLADTLIGKRV